MGEQQISLDLDVAYRAAPAVVAELRDEIAHAWSLPLGKRVEVRFRGGQRSAVIGWAVSRELRLVAEGAEAIEMP